MRKTILFLVIALTLACRHGQIYNAKHFANPCRPGEGHETDPPVVCIDRDSLQPSQNPVVLSGGQKPSRNIGHFFITYPKSGDVLKITCDGADVIIIPVAPDHVIVKANPVGQTQKYKYTIDINGRQNDPDMQIDP